MDEKVGRFDVVVKKTRVVEVKETPRHSEGEMQEKVKAHGIDEEMIDGQTDVCELCENGT